EATMSTPPPNDRCRVCQRVGVHLLIGGRCTPCRVQAGQMGAARVRLPPDLPGLLGVPPDAPALAFTRAGGPEWPGYVVELLVVPSGRVARNAAGEPVWDRAAVPRDEGLYALAWVEPRPDGGAAIFPLPARAFRARVYVSEPAVWVEHL